MHKSMTAEEFKAFFILYTDEVSAPFQLLYVFIIDHKKKKAKKNRGVVTFVILLCDTMHYRKSAGCVMNSEIAREG